MRSKMEALIVVSLIVLCFMLLAVLGMDRYATYKYNREYMDKIDSMVKFMENRRVLEQSEVKKFISNLMHFYEKEIRKDREYSIKTMQDNNKLFFDEMSRVYSDFAERFQFPTLKFPAGFNRRGISDKKLSKEAIENIEKETEDQIEKNDKRTPEEIASDALSGLSPEMRRSSIFDDLNDKMEVALKKEKAASKKENGELDDGES